MTSSRTLPILSAALAAALLAAPAAADVLVVDFGGGGDFLRVQHAIDAASDGDVILVREPGTTDNGGWVVDGKALTIVGDVAPGSGERVNVSGGTVRNLPAGETVVLRNLLLEHEAASDSSLRLEDNAGAVWIEDCEVHGRNETAQVFGDLCQNMAVTAGAHAVDATDCAAVIVVRSELFGGVGQDAVFVPGPGADSPATDAKYGLRAVSSEVAIYESELRGGDGGGGVLVCNQTGDAGHGLFLALSSALVVGSAIHGGELGTGAPADAVRGSFGATLEWQASTFQTGAGGVGLNISPSQVTQYTGAPRFARLASPLREGQVGSLEVQGLVGDAVGVFWALDADALSMPTRKGWFVLKPGQLVGPSFLGTITAPSGLLTLPVLVPSLPASTEGLSLMLQGYAQNPGGIALTSGSSLTVLDAGF